MLVFWVHDWLQASLSSITLSTSSHHQWSISSSGCILPCWVLLCPALVCWHSDDVIILAQVHKGTILLRGSVRFGGHGALEGSTNLQPHYVLCLTRALGLGLLVYCYVPDCIFSYYSSPSFQQCSWSKHWIPIDKRLPQGHVDISLSEHWWQSHNTASMKFVLLHINLPYCCIRIYIHIATGKLPGYLTAWQFYTSVAYSKYS